MTKSVFLFAEALLAAAVLLMPCTPVPARSADNSLDTLLKEASSSGVPLFGHQDDLMYGHSWNANKDDDHTFIRSDIRSVSGSYPYVLGLDLGGIEKGDSRNLDGNDFDLTREAAVKHYERGGVITLSWHLRNPLTGGDTWDVSSRRAVESILPGGKKHELFLQWLDRVSEYIASFRDSEGKPIPLIWRPWHEHTGGWFWWGASNCTAEQFNELWRMTYEYMVGVKGLHNLLWAISPNSVADFEKWEERYPGDDYVDIVGLDVYCFTPVSKKMSFDEYQGSLKSCLKSLDAFAASHGKILALTETGYEGIPYGKWWTEVLQPAIDGFPIAWLLVWRNTDERPRGLKHFYAPWPGGPSEKDFVEWVSSGKVRLLPDQPAF